MAAFAAFRPSYHLVSLFKYPLAGHESSWSEIRFGSKKSIKSAYSPDRTYTISYLFNSNPTITPPTAATHHISATLLVAVMAPPATTGPTTALSE